ncbi:hypothetical protein EPIB2_625 [Tritonibacter mobilis]|nr:hypothetical protein EPIB2_625 [Tritonibacter mobilis]
MVFLRFPKHSGGPLHWGKTKTIWFVFPIFADVFERGFVAPID